MRRFYVAYSKWQTVSAKLSWSHYIELLGISDEIMRSFYEKQAIHENWSKRELERQIDSSLFERLALSKDKKGVLKLSEKGYIISNYTEAVKDPYVLDFLKIPQSIRMTEVSRLLPGNTKFHFAINIITLTWFFIIVFLNVLYVLI